MTQARIWKKQGKVEAAIAKFQEALSLRSCRPEMRCQIAFIYWEQNEKERARKEMEIVRDCFRFDQFAEPFDPMKIESAEEIIEIARQFESTLR